MSPSFLVKILSYVRVQAACPKFHISCRLGREVFILPVCCLRCPWRHGLGPKKLYHTLSVAVTPVALRFPIQRPLVPSFTQARSETFQTTLVTGIKLQNYFLYLCFCLSFISARLLKVTNNLKQYLIESTMSRRLLLTSGKANMSTEYWTK